MTTASDAAPAPGRTWATRLWAAAAAGYGMIRQRQVTTAQFRVVTSIVAWALASTIVTGGAVRLTGSGLGCPDWPTCASHRVVAPLQYHAWVEFGNRLITTVVSVAVVLAVVAAVARVRRRRDLTWLSLGLVAGILAEIVLGGLTVEHKLAPGFVMAHFLLAAAFLADAIVLHHRAGLPDKPDPGRPGRTRAAPSVRVVSGPSLVLGRVLLVAAAVVVALGTVVTSTGPHGGDPKAPRFGFSLHAVAQLHGSSVEVFLALTLLTLWVLNRSSAPETVMRRGEILLVVLIIQGGIGYLQYFNGDPAGVVALHLVGATALMAAVLHFNLGLTAPAPAGAPNSAGASAPAGT